MSAPRRFPVAVVAGASGAIGAAFIEHLLRTGSSDRVVALSRAGDGPHDARVMTLALDYDDPASAKNAAREVARAGLAPALILVATGLLHGAGLRPEKSLAQIDAAAVARILHVNAIGPMLLAQAFMPLMAKGGHAVFAALSARVGSIGENRLGGWYAYRASKAALNMMLRTAAIELSRTHPQAICVGLHPGTVDSGLSAPFQRNVAPGQLFPPEVAAQHLCTVLERLSPADSGKVLAWDGAEIPP